MSGTSVKTATLTNGLKVIGETNSQHKSCAIGYFVRTGARDEEKKESGISHFLEHMMFKGTDKRSSMDVTLELGNLGAQANAFTSEENTVYYAAVVPEHFSKMQELLTDMLRPSLTQSEFDTEKNVILEEIALYQDRPSFYLGENSNLLFFNGHPAGNSVLGTTESVSAIEQPDMRAYFDRRYSPSNMVLVASGNFDWDSFLLEAEKLTESWNNSTVFRAKPEFLEPGNSHVFKKKNLNQSHLLLLSPGCSAQDDERFALSVLSVILGDSAGSKFYWELIDSGLAESAYADSDERDACGTFSAYACTAPEKVEEVAKVMHNLLADAENISSQELERAKTKIATRVVLSGELPMGRLMALGMEWNYRSRLHNLQNEIERYSAVTLLDIKNALYKFPFKFSEYRLLPE